MTTEGMSPRQLALHVGRKSGLMLAMNTLSKYSEGQEADMHITRQHLLLLQRW
jgi:hypothetical protein